MSTTCRACIWSGHRSSSPNRQGLRCRADTRRVHILKEEDLAFQAFIGLEGWAMSDQEWKDYRDRLLPNGLVLVYHTASNSLVASAGALHNPNPGRYYFPFGGGLGYLLVHPDHRRRGLGYTASALVVRRLLAAGYESIRVGVQGFRLAAIKTYLKVGFVPFLHQENLMARWRRICRQISWPFTPDTWPKTLSGHQ
jgi:mycothiol synthase